MDGFESGGSRDSHVAAMSRPLATRNRGKISVPVFLGLVRAVDILLMVAVWLAASRLVDSEWRGIDLLAGAPGLWVSAWCLKKSGIYALPKLRLWAAQVTPLMLSHLAGAVVSGGGYLLLNNPRTNPLAVPFCWMMLSLAVLSPGRAILARVIALPAMASRLNRTIAVVGANHLSRRFIERIQADRWSNDHVLGVFDDRLSRVPAVHAGVPVLGRLDDLLLRGREQPIDAIVVALPLSATVRIDEVCERLRTAVSDVYLTTGIAVDPFDARRFRGIGSNPVIEVWQQPLKDWSALQKRLFDVIVAGLILAMVAPVMLLIALAIRLDTPGPVLFRQPRRGFNNNEFTVFKFRTMHHHLGDPAGRCQTIPGDPRVTFVGRYLRRLSFDELPQIFNVLRGDMSLVGPRPHALNTRAGERLLEDAIADYAMRHRVRPGITGWAQVNGSRGAISNEGQLRRRVDHDLYYISNWSLTLDLKILFMTLKMETHRTATC